MRLYRVGILIVDCVKWFVISSSKWLCRLKPKRVVFEATVVVADIKATESVVADVDFKSELMTNHDAMRPQFRLTSDQYETQKTQFTKESLDRLRNICLTEKYKWWKLKKPKR